MFLSGLVVGFYLGGALVTNVVVGKTVNGQAPTLVEKICLPLFWPYTLWSAGEPEDS
jgi:hypothetical protein